MFIRQSQRKIILLDLAHCVYTELEKNSPSSNPNLEDVYVYVYKKSFGLSCTIAEEKLSGHIQIQTYCSYTNIIHTLTHIQKSSWDKWVIVYYERLMNHDNLFIIPSVTSAVDPKHFSGLATREGGKGQVRPKWWNPQILVNVHQSHTKQLQKN